MYMPCLADDLLACRLWGLQDVPMPVLDPEVQKSFDVAYENIKAFHQAQKNTEALSVETMPGVVCRRVSRPIGNPRLPPPLFHPNPTLPSWIPRRVFLHLRNAVKHLY